ncbi:MAG: helix-turn-helix transcriptional regulator [Ruminiclostridium sp.]
MKTETTRLKASRILKIYTDLINGEIVSKSEAVEKYGVSPRTIQRDIDNIRAFLGEQPETGLGQIVHSKKLGGYIIRYSGGSVLSNEEMSILQKLLYKTDPQRRTDLLKAMDKLIDSKQEERSAEISEKLSDFRRAVKEKRYICIKYRYKDGEILSKRIMPTDISVKNSIVSVVDSSGKEPELYSMDCIDEYKISDTTFEE